MIWKVLVLILFLSSYAVADQDATINQMNRDSSYCYAIHNMSNRFCDTTFTVDGTADHFLYLLPPSPFGENLTFSESELTYVIATPLLFILALGPFIIALAMGSFAFYVFKNVVFDNI